MKTAPASVTYVLPDKLGGVLTMVSNLIVHRPAGALPQHAVLTRNRLDADAVWGRPVGADSQVGVEYRLPVENLHAVLRRLRAALPEGPGVLVSNDWLELAMLCAYDPGKTVIQILQGDYDYYYDLAVKHEPVIDVFVTHSRQVYDGLRRRLPGRLDSIHHLRYGVPLPPKVRRPQASASAPLRLLFLGRLVEEKGLFDLPAIDRHLRAAGVAVSWTVVGCGPGRRELDALWDRRAAVRYESPATNAEVLDLCADHDVFVLPSRAEGFPVSLLEAMGTGLVPVVSDLPSGIPEIVEQGVTGFRPAVGDVAGFAAAVAELHRDRDRLEAMSRAARRVVAEQFDVRERARAYHDLYARHAELRRPRPRRTELIYGSRLDRPWIPNPVVVALRSWLGRKRFRRLAAAAEGG